jgi:hypothetical protein
MVLLLSIDEGDDDGDDDDDGSERMNEVTLHYTMGITTEEEAKDVV